MELGDILNLIVNAMPAARYLLMGLGGLVVLGQVYVALTPNQDDDAWFARLEGVPVVGALIRAVKAFAPIQRKEQ